MIKKVSCNELKIGMYIAEIKASWFLTPFLTHTFLITSNKQLIKLKSTKIKAIYIDTHKGLDVGEEPEKKEVPVVEIIEEAPKPVDFLSDIEEEEEEELDENGEIIEERIPFTKELQEAKEVRKDMENVVNNTMTDIKLGKSVNAKGIADAAKSMVDSVYRNKHAITSLARLKDFNEYTFNHCVNVAILAATFGRHLKLPKKDIVILGMGGIMHDLGKMKVPESILNKPGSFTPEEFEIMKMHVNYTNEILEKTEGIPDEVKMFASQHHERCDGRGYPSGLNESDLSIYGKVGAIVDVYDAITSDRVYHTARLPFDALRFLFSLSNNSLYKPYVESFIQCIGIYPIGSYVLLDTNEIAVVVSINKTELLRPVVRIMVNDRGFQVQNHPIVDLAETKGNGKTFNRRIIKSVHEKDYNLPVSTELAFLN